MELARGSESRGIRDIAPPSAPCVQHTFLFVNESTALAGRKIGRRHDIKSHVRNHIVQREKRSQKESRNAKGAAKKEPQQILTGINSYGGERKKSVEEDSKWNILRLSPNSESAHPTMVSPLRDPLQPEQLYIEHGALPRDIFIENVDDKAKNYHAIQEMHEAYCLVCGAPQTEKEKSNAKPKNSNTGQFSVVAREAVRRQSSRVGPLEILGSGRVNPFACYPTMVDDPNGSLHELLDHSFSYLLPGLLADGSRTQVSSVSKAWMGSGLNSPLLFHALVFAGSIHLDFLRSKEIHPNAPVALSHKLAVIQQLNLALRDPTERSRDEIILAILILATHEVMDLSEDNSHPFNAPLQSMQWLNVYGNIRNVDEHMKAVMDLVTLRGGVHNLELYGLAEILVGGDVVAATISLSKPAFPPLKRVVHWIAHVLEWAKSPPRLSVMSLGSGFQDYVQYGITSEFLSILEVMSAVTIGIEHYLKGEPQGLSLTAIARTRTSCQHRLLSLPSDIEIRELPLCEPYMYEAVHMTALIYSTAVLFPIPRSFKVLQEMVQRLRAAIEESEVESYGDSLSDLLLWMLILGGIASLDKPEKPWYVERLLVFARKWKYDWKSVERIMKKFLWLESACAPGGRTLWMEVTLRNSFPGQINS